MSNPSKAIQLFSNAQQDGNLSVASANILQVNDIGAQIQSALGVSVEDVTASEVVLYTALIDDTGSISASNNQAPIRSGYNLSVEALQDCKQKDGILVMNRYFSGKILSPFVMIDQAVKMDGNNYRPNFGHTSLYDNAIVTLGTVLAKAQEFADNGVPVRTITLIMTDGDDNSSRATAADVAKIVKDMRRAENHIIAAMGVDSGGVNFNDVFSQMGIQKEWIMTPGNTASDIRAAFQVFSRSAVRASQSAKNFSQAAVGGFAA